MNEVDNSIISNIKQLMNEKKYEDVKQIAKLPQYLNDRFIQYQCCRAFIYLNQKEEVEEIAKRFPNDRMIQNIYLKTLVELSKKNKEKYINSLELAKIEIVTDIELRNIKTRIINNDLSLAAACIETNKGKKTLVRALCKIDAVNSEEQLKFEEVLTRSDDLEIIGKIKQDKIKNKELYKSRKLKSECGEER